MCPTGCEVCFGFRGVDRHRRGGAASLTAAGIGREPVGLKLIPTPQTDPTEGNRSARSEPAVERIPDQACLSTLSAGPLLVCDTRPIHSMDRATQTPRACRSAHDHSFQGLNDMDRLFAKPSRAEQSRTDQRRRCLRIGINDAQG